MRCHTTDGVAFLAAQPEGSYDLVCIDAADHDANDVGPDLEAPPAPFCTAAFFATLRNVLAPGGFVTVNAIARRDQVRLPRAPAYYALGIFGATLPERIGFFDSSSRKVVPISPNASYPRRLTERGRLRAVARLLRQVEGRGLLPGLCHAHRPERRLLRVARQPRPARPPRRRATAAAGALRREGEGVAEAAGGAE